MAMQILDAGQGPSGLIAGIPLQDFNELADNAFAQEWKQRAALLIHLRRHGEAIADLNRYLELEPDADDAKGIREVVTDLRKSLARLN